MCCLELQYDCETVHPEVETPSENEESPAIVSMIDAWGSIRSAKTSRQRVQHENQMKPDEPNAPLCPPPTGPHSELSSKCQLNASPYLTSNITAR